MPKVTCRILKQNINENNIKKIYYFIGEETFLIENFTNKIFEISIGMNYKKNINFFSFNIETLDINKLFNSINMFPVNSEKKCILLKGTNFNEMDSIFFDKLISILNDTPDFCTIVIHDFSDNNKKNIYYSNFISKILKIAEYSEFKHEKVPTEKQAIIWAKQFNKVLSSENSKILCKRCLNDFNLIKNTIENICITLKDDEISKDYIGKLNIISNEKYSIFDICKSIRNKNLYESLKIFDILISEKEDPFKIFSVISSEFIDAFKIKVSLSHGETISSISKIFDYKGKEFKIYNAKDLCKIYNIDECIKILLNTDILLKTSNISPKFLIDRAIVEIIMIQKIST